MIIKSDRVAIDINQLMVILCAFIFNYIVNDWQFPGKTILQDTVCARRTRKLQEPCKINIILQEIFLARYVTKFLARINDNSCMEVCLLAR